MASEDDDFPPEITKEPDEFAFHELPSVKAITSDKQPNYPAVRTHLLAVANKYGYVFVGTPTGLKVFLSADILAAVKKNEEKLDSPIATIVLKNRPNWLALSADNLTLCVGCQSEKGPQILFFDIRNVVNECKPSKTPFYQQHLSKTIDAYFTSVTWSPLESVSHLAVCLSTGSFFFMSLSESGVNISSEPDSFGASAVTWSPDGKHVLVGKQDGTLVQLTQKLETKRSISVTDVIDRSVKTCDLVWLSPNEVGAAYVESDDDNFSQPNLFMANMLGPEVKEGIPVSWRNYEDPCYGMAESRESQYFFVFIEQWKMFITLCSNSAGTAVVAKNNDSEIWEIWALNDSSRATLPFSVYTEEDSSPIGVCIVTTATEKIILSESREYKPMPVLMILTDDGILCSYDILNLNKDYPNFVHAPKQLDFSGERTPFKKEDTTAGGGDGRKTDMASMKKKPLTAKPSVVPMGTPRLGFNLLQSDQKATQLPSLGFSSSTPVVGKSVHKPFPEEPSISLEENHSDGLSKRTAAKPPLPLFPKRCEIVAPDKDKVVPPTKGPSVTQPSSSKLEGMGSKLAPQSRMNKRVPEKRYIEPLHEGSKSHSYSSSSDLFSAFDDIANFDAEVRSFKSSLQNVQNCCMDSKNKTEIAELENLMMFSRDICKTSSELSYEIQETLTSLLALICDTEAIGQKFIPSTLGSYYALLYGRPLDPSQRKKLEAQRDLFQYIVSSVKEINSTLDYQWENRSDRMKSQKDSFQRSKLRTSEWESAHHGLLNNLNFVHDQETKIMLLSQQIDRLRVWSTSKPASRGSSVRPNSDKLSGDLQVLADSFLSKKEPTAMPENKPEKAKKPNFSQKRQSRLGQILAKRQVKPILTSSKAHSSIIRPLVQQQSTHDSDSISSESNTPSEEYYSSDYEDTGAAQEILHPVASSFVIPQGAATLGYGVPSSVKAEAKRRDYPPLAEDVEASSNLNNPPQVVNIQNVSEAFATQPHLHEKFEPSFSPEVPAGAMQVMQNMLKMVNSEKSQQDSSKLYVGVKGGNQTSLFQDKKVPASTATSSSTVSTVIPFQSVPKSTVDITLTAFSVTASQQPAVTMTTSFGSAAAALHSKPQATTKSELFPGSQDANKNVKPVDMPELDTPLPKIGFGDAKTLISSSNTSTMNIVSSVPSKNKESFTKTGMPAALELQVVDSYHPGSPNKISETLQSSKSALQSKVDAKVVGVESSLGYSNSTASETYKAQSESAQDLALTSASPKDFSGGGIDNKSAVTHDEMLHHAPFAGAENSIAVSATDTVPVTSLPSPIQNTPPDNKLESKEEEAVSMLATKVSEDQAWSATTSQVVPSTSLPKFHPAGPIEKQVSSHSISPGGMPDNDTHSGFSSPFAPISGGTVTSAAEVGLFGKGSVTSVFSTAGLDAASTGATVSSPGSVTDELSGPFSSTSFGTPQVGGKNKVEAMGGNPFFRVSQQQDSKPETSLFGSIVQKPLSEVPQTSNFGGLKSYSSGSSNVFGLLNKSQFGAASKFGSSAVSQQSQFGAAPTFGSSVVSQPSQFGAASTFGSSAVSQTSQFGAASTFGSSAVSQPSQFGAAPTFGSSAVSQPSQFGAAPTFGSTAVSQPSQFGAASTFGSSAVSQPSQFGAAPTFGSSAVFGSPSSFGSSTFGSVKNDTFGSSTFGAPRSTGLFGQGSEGGFASFAKNDAMGFGSLANQSSFGTPQQSGFSQSTFEASSQKSPSFTGWR